MGKLFQPSRNVVSAKCRIVGSVVTSNCRLIEDVVVAVVVVIVVVAVVVVVEFNCIGNNSSQP